MLTLETQKKMPSRIRTHDFAVREIKVRRAVRLGHGDNLFCK